MFRRFELSSATRVNLLNCTDKKLAEIHWFVCPMSKKYSFLRLYQISNLFYLGSRGCNTFKKLNEKFSSLYATSFSVNVYPFFRPFIVFSLIVVQDRNLPKKQKNIYRAIELLSKIVCHPVFFKPEAKIKDFFESAKSVFHTDNLSEVATAKHNYTKNNREFFYNFVTSLHYASTDKKSIVNQIRETYKLPEWNLEEASNTYKKILKNSLTDIYIIGNFNEQKMVKYLNVISKGFPNKQTLPGSNIFVPSYEEYHRQPILLKDIFNKPIKSIFGNDFCSLSFHFKKFSFDTFIENLSVLTILRYILQREMENREGIFWFKCDHFLNVLFMEKTQSINDFFEQKIIKETNKYVKEVEIDELRNNIMTELLSMRRNCGGYVLDDFKNRFLVGRRNYVSDTIEDTKHYEKVLGLTKENLLEYISSVEIVNRIEFSVSN